MFSSLNFNEIKMLKCIIYSLCVALLTSGVLSQEIAAADTSTSSSASSSSSTSVPPSSSTSVPPSSSTSAPPTSSTSAPPTSSTSAPPTSSTSVPTDSTTGASSSTVSPSTSVGPVTTAAPDIPKPTKGNWNVSEGNTTCIRAQMAALFTIKLTPERTAYIALSPNASSDDSNCETSNTTQTLVLSDLTYTFSLEFEKDAKQVYVKEVKLAYNIEGVTGNVQSDNNTRLYPVTAGKSYLCNANKSITIENVTISLTEVHLQAFGKEDNTGFTADEECDADDDVSQIVPIAVGCALAALVVVVLIAYLVGRRRSRQKGYQSV